MTTKDSPIERLRDHAEKIALTLKRAAEGGIHDKPTTKIGIVMDDKIITMDIPWETIKSTEHAALVDFIVDEMQERQRTLN